MKLKICLTLVTCLVVTIVFSQAPSNELQKTEIGKLKAWVGLWKGEGWIRMGPGEPKKSKVVERIELKLDETILVVEGLGTAPDASGVETVVHNAFGIVSYDPNGKKYSFKTYTKEGRTADAWFNKIEDNKYEWGFDIPNRGKTKYSITLDPAKNTWIEVGEFSMDGTNWMKFFEMNLTKSNN